MRTAVLHALTGIAIVLFLLWAVSAVLDMPDHVCDPRVTLCE